MLLKRTILSLLLLAVATLQLHAQAQVSLSLAQGHPGDELELVLSLKGGEAVTALEATIALPAALSYVEGSAQLNTGRVAPSHQIAATQADGLLKLYVYSTALDLLKSQDGELLRFRLLLGREPSAYTLQPADPEHRMLTIALEGTAYATNRLSLAGHDVAGHPEQYRVEVSLQNSTPIAGMQADLHWLPGMTATAGQSLTLQGRAAQHHATLTRLADGHYRVYLWSDANQPIAAGEGAVLSPGTAHSGAGSL